MKWFTDMAERALATAAEVALPAFVGANVWDIDYRAATGLTLAATAVSVLKSIVARFKGNEESASLAD